MNKKYTLTGEVEILLAKEELEVKKSKFISYVYNVSNEEQITKILDNIRTINKEARHIVYAYRLENSGRYTDDREPSGTAGKPIYAMLEKENFVNILVIVVRYFGGILLGTGPLTRAYLGVASDAIGKCTKIAYVKYKREELVVEYSEESIVLRQIEQKSGKVVDVQYEDKIRIIVDIPEENNNKKSF